MKKGQLLQLIKTCYGLLDGPMAWFKHLKRVFENVLNPRNACGVHKS